MNTSMLHRDTWIEIHLDKIEHNIKEMKKILPENTKFMAAVKADAYGHGDVQIARLCEQSGVDALAVSILAEGLNLRRNHITLPILILTPILPSDVDLAIKNNLSVTVFQKEWFYEMRKYKKSEEKLKVHIKIDTGLGRLGLKTVGELGDLATELKHEDIVVEGFYTHFATANHEDGSYLIKQYAAFMELVEVSKRMDLAIESYHCANSAATLKYSQTHLDMVRLGVSMFGIYPSREIKEMNKVNLQSGLSFHTKLLYVKKLTEGESIGYDRSYCAKEGTWIGTLPVGYADGWFRCFQGFKVLIDGQEMPIIGKICMDQLMVVLPKEYPIGTKVTLIGRNGDSEITLESLAEHIHSVPQEIPSMLNYRVPRVYYYQGQPVEVLTDRLWKHA